MNPDFNILKSLYLLVEPTCVIVSSQVPEPFISVLKSVTGAGSPSGHSTNRENIQPEMKLNILPRKDYSKLLIQDYFLTFFCYSCFGSGSGLCFLYFKLTYCLHLQGQSENILSSCGQV